MWRYVGVEARGVEVWGHRGMGRGGMETWDLGYRERVRRQLDMEKRHRAACWFGKGYETQVYVGICGDTGTWGVDAPGCEGRKQDIASGKKPGNEATTHTAS